ncbi:MAG TPA: hypothetical protein VGN63_01470 [Flavisolibacter sp.]|nr:hypothetical protein [Flavisolibacter sp.]
MKSYWLRKISCWILLLQMINLSIDPPDTSVVFESKSSFQSEIERNERESVYEYVSEALLEFEIPDTEEQDIEKSVHALELYYSSPPSFSLINPALPILHCSFYSSSYFSWETKPNAPPPKGVVYTS